MSQSVQTDGVNDTPASEQPSRGQRLRAAREAQGWGREEVALRLRLNTGLIASLETDDLEHLPPRAFVNGYVRNYARLLGLPENELLDKAALPTENILISSIREPEKVSSSRIPYTWVFGLILIMLVVLMGIWWFSEHQATPWVPMQAADVAAPEQPVQTVPADDPVPSAEPRDTREDTVALEAAGEIKPADVAETTSEALEVPTIPVVEAPMEEPLPAAPQPQARLRLSFSDNCWVEVLDAADRQLAYDLITEDKTLELVGQAPFRIFLGYAPAAQIYLNDTLFDHRSYQRGDIARFRLGSAGDNQLPGE